jgi:hypothetical protein
MFPNFLPGRRPALRLTVPNGTFNRAIVTLWHSFSASLKTGKVEIHPLFARLPCLFLNCGTVIAWKLGTDNHF